jgi:menaquinone-dependent protoporphyrinogen oxidase
MNILIIYASKHETTQECSFILQNELSGDADLVPLSNVTDFQIEQYDAVVVGSPVYYSKPDKKVTDFLNKHENMLLSKKIYLFLSSKEETNEYFAAYPQKVVEQAQAKIFVGSRLEFKNLSIIERIIVKALKAKSYSDIKTERIRHLAEIIKEDLRFTK